MKKLLLCLFLLAGGLLIPYATQAQQLTQTIRGTVVDVDTKEPLVGAQVMVTNVDPGLGAITDDEGRYLIEEVPVGRRALTCSYVGYARVVRDNINLNSAREYVVDFEMKSGLEMDEVNIEAFRRNEAVNELAVLSVRRLDPEELQFHAATANDPSRLVMGYPGVQPSWDVRNEIVVRGNSPLGVLWRLEGIDIPNPNHYAFAGGSGGGITIFSASMLGSSDFSSGAFTADYGNALSGVFDMNFRNGNMYNREHTFRLGILGLDYATEGPIKEGKSSYLANFRYSTLGILNSLGVHLVGERIDNNFYDLSFKLHHEGKRSQFSLWGIGGSSLQRLNPADTLGVFTQYRVYDWTTEMAVIGATWNFLIDDKSYFRTNVAFTGQRLLSIEDTLSVTTQEPSLIDEETILNTQISLHSYYKRTFGPRLNLKAGAILTRFGYDFFHQTMDFVEELETVVDVEGHTFMAQPYFQFSFRPTDKWMINAGAHAMYLGLNGTHSVEPRLAVRYQINELASLAASYGLHSHLVPWDIYFTDVDGELPNLELELMKSNHFILAYDQMLGRNWRIHLETYLQQLYDIPVVDDPSRKIWLLNRVNGYNRDPMVSEGTGRNVGLDLTLEKFFDAGAFFVLSGSAFNSTFQVPGDETVYSTRFNAQYVANFTGGRTFPIGDNAALETSMRLIYSNGNPVVPLQPGTETIAGRRPYWDFSNPYQERVGMYFRPDIRVAFRKNNPRSAYWLALDIQNFINRVNRDAFEYDFNEASLQWENRTQATLTPIITFWIDF